MPASLIVNHHSTTDATSHTVPLSGKTTARDILALVATPAIPTLPADWVEEGAYAPGGGAFVVRLWHLPAFMNTSLVTELTIPLSGSRPLIAVVWEDDVDADAPNFVFEPVSANNPPNSDTPALWGTGLHTFTQRDEAYAFFYLQSQFGEDLDTFDLASYDEGFTDFGDSGKATGIPTARLWAARHPAFTASNAGVTATANVARPGSSVLGPAAAGMLAYDTGDPLPPTPVLRHAPANLSLAYEIGGDAPEQTISIRNSGGGGTIDWEADDDADWLTISPVNGTGVEPGVPDTPMVSVNPAGLQAGTYTATITITAAGVPGSPRTIPVSLVISPQSLDSAPHEPTRTWRLTNGAFRRMRDQEEGTTSPEMHGARGDAILLTDAAISENTAQLDSAAGRFKSSDVGKWVTIRGAGLTLQGGAMMAQIESYVSATRVILDRDAAATVSGAVATYGTDDTQAFRDAIDELVTAGISGGSYFGKLLVPARHYMIASDPVLGGDTLGHAQIPLPYIPTSGPKFVLSIQGPGDASHFYHWRQNAIRGGAVLHSPLVGQHIDLTYGVPSVIGGPTHLDAEPDLTSPFSNMLVHIDGISVLCPRNPSLLGVDLARVGQANIGTLSVNADGTVVGGNLAGSATNDQGMALRMPAFQNNDNTNVFSFASEGFFYGIQIADHFTAQRLAIIYADTAIYCAPGGSPEHGTHIAYISCEACKNGIQSGGGAGGKYPMFIGRLDIEVSGDGYTIIDPNDTLYGEVHYAHNGSASPTIAPKPGDGTPGAQNLRIVDNNRARGPATAPTVPASNTPFYNPFFRDAAVHVTGGTVSAIKVDGQTLGVTSGLVMVPSGRAISITYSSAPSWAWTLL